MRKVALVITALAVSIGALSGATAPEVAEAASHHKSAYAKSYGTFKAVSASGTSDSVIALPKKAKYGIIVAKYTGSSNFIIEGLDKTNQSTIDSPVNTIGNYTGTTAFGLEALGSRTRTLKVTADGAWTVTVEPISKAPKLPSSGAGDGVFRYSKGATTWKLSNSGSGNFIVEQTTNGMANPLVNEIGAYSGTVAAVGGKTVVTIKSDGNWTVG